VTALLLLLWPPAGPPSGEGVSLDDLARFPTRTAAVREANRVREHAERLRFLRSCRAYHPSDARDLATLAAWLDYYDWLVIATTEAHATEFRLLALARLRGMLGEHHYARGWRPPAMPDEMLPEPGVWRPAAARETGNQ
jgi:hypothetical protein